MLKKTLTFRDMDGVEHTEDWYFGLDAADVARLELASNGMLSDRLAAIGQRLEENDGSEEGKEKIVRANGREIMQLFEELIMASVGKRSEDGRRHVKNDDIRTDFQQTGSFGEFLIELSTNPVEASQFINQIFPNEALERLRKGQTAVSDLQLPEDNKPAWFTEGRVPTDAEIKGTQDPQLLQEAFRRKSALPTSQ